MEEKNKDMKKSTVNIDLELLKKIRNLLEVSNTRIHWKIDELLPVGLIIKEMDDLLMNKE